MGLVKHKLKELVLEKQRELGRSITHDEIAKAAGVSRQTITTWMNTGELGGIKSPTIIGLCRYFGKRDVGELVYIDWQGNPPIKTVEE